MLREMMQAKYRGNTLEIDLSKWGYPDYTVMCTYSYDKKKGKYLLSLWLQNTAIEDRMKLSSKKVDAQYIPGTRETIVENISRIVYQCVNAADETGRTYLDRFVERYEYELACFDRGNEQFERESIRRR